jgi:histidyl-tRNA synthetase
VTDDQGPPRAPKGTRDTLWPESARWEALVARFAHRASLAGFGLVVNPTFEEVRLFRRGVGESTEVVSKEMYEFTDRGGRDLALRPEGTAPVVRAFIEHRPPVPWKAWYLAPSFRYERAQAGRFRQHHQVGVEALGTEDPDLDVEVIALAAGFLADLGLVSVTLLLNSIGDQVCRPAYVVLLRDYLAARRDELCDEHGPRLEANPLRVLDCKTPQCRAVAASAPVIADHLCDPCAAHHARVREGLDALGVAYEAAPHLVRGLDYYTRTAFEFVSARLEAAQVTICGGGRYDGLVEQLGGPPTPGIGFGAGIERVLLACDAEGVFPAAPAPPAAFVVDLTDGRGARDLVAELRGAGLGAERAYDGRSLRAQLRLADRAGAVVALIVGAEEAADGVVSIRPLRHDGEQRRVPRDQVVDEVRRALSEAGDRREERGTS